MARLRDPNKQIPGGLRYRQTETGWNSTKTLPPMPSLRTLTAAVIAHRKGNPHLLSVHKWKIDPGEVELEMNEYNAAVCLQNGWKDYVMVLHGEPPPPKSYTPSHSTGRGAVAAIVAGGKTLASWIGAGGRPVPLAVAERRAGVCSGCTQNDRGDWTRFFTQGASEIIRKQIELKNDLKLTTSKDAELKVCDVCTCPLQLKVWVPIEHILQHTDEATMAKLPEHCWVKLKQ